MNQKIKQNNQIYTICLYVMVFSCVGLCTSISLGKGSHSILSMLLLFMPWISMGYYFLSNKNEDNKLLLFIILFGVAVISMLLTGRSGLYNNIIHTMSFMTLPAYLIVYTEVQDTAKIRQWIYMFYIVLSVVFIYAAQLPFAYDTTDEYGYEYISESLILCFGNPNAASVNLTICAGVVCSAMVSAKNRLIKLLLALDVCQLCWLIWLTGSRACIVVIILVAIMYLLGRSKRRITRRRVWLFLLIPFVYWLLTASSVAFFDNATLMGENLSTGREAIYLRYMQQQDLSLFLIGNFSEFRFENLHNGYVAILATIGFAGFVPFFLLLRACLNKFTTNQIVLTKSQYFAACFVLALVAYQAVEAAIFSMGSIYGAGFALLYFLALPDKEAEPT